MKNDHNFEEPGLQVHAGGLIPPALAEASAWDFAAGIHAALVEAGLSPTEIRNVGCWLISVSHVEEWGGCDQTEP